MSNYGNGYALERAARKDYEARGWFVVRAGGSKGPADLVAITYNATVDGPNVDLVQCKVDGKIGTAERELLLGLASRLGAVPVVAFWSKDGRAARTVAFREA